MTGNDTAQQTLAIAPTLKQIDALILEHAAAQAELLSGGAIKQLPGESAAELEVRLKAWQKTAAETRAAATAKADEVKERLVATIKAYGVKHAEKSMRLSGEHNRATGTWGTRVETVTAGVSNLKEALGKSKIPGISEMFFTEHITYQLVASPAEVLKTIKLTQRMREKINSLIALCFEVKTNAPSLKVEAVAAAKPTVKAA
jgi:hypothetical protein